MSEVQIKIKDLAQELDFLNGEVGRVKSNLEKLKIDEETAVQLKEARDKGFSDDIAKKQGEFDRISKQVELKSIELLDINSEIGKNIIILGETKSEKKVLDEKMAADKAEKEKIDKLFKDRKESLDNLETTLKEREKGIMLGERSLEEKSKILQNRDEVSKGEAVKLENELKEVEVHKLKLKEKEEKANDLIRENEARSKSLDSREEKLREDLQKFASDKIQLFEYTDLCNARQIKLNSVETELDSRDSKIYLKEKELADREEMISIKERELRIREKNLSLKEME